MEAKAEENYGSGIKPVKLAPSILTADFGHLADQIAAAEAGGINLIHLDVMDGRFVNITFGTLIVHHTPTIGLPLDVAMIEGQTPSLRNSL